MLTRLNYKILFLYILNCLYIHKSYSQEKVFSPTGKISISKLTIDTVLNLKSNFNKSSIMFSKIDTEQIAEDSNLLSVLKKYIRRSNIDSIEYLYLFNPTNKPLVFPNRFKAEKNNLLGVEFAKKEPGKYLPITCIVNNLLCANGRIDAGTFILNPNCLAVIKNDIRDVFGNKKAFAKIKIVMSSGEKIMSAPFITYIDYDAFVLRDDSYLNWHPDKISFLE